MKALRGEGGRRAAHRGQGLRLLPKLFLGCAVGIGVGSGGLTAQLSPGVEQADPRGRILNQEWAHAVHALAAERVEAGETGLAEVWLRFALRHAPGHTLSPVGEAARGVKAVWTRVRGEVTPDLGEAEGVAPVRTEWLWDSAVASGPEGALDWNASQGIPLGAQLRVQTDEGLAVLMPGVGGLSLAPGSYVIRGTAPGHLPWEVVREVLPGVTTVIQGEFVPTLTQGAREEGGNRLVRIRWGASAAMCQNGILVGGGRAVLTVLRGLGPVDALEVTLAEGRTLTGVTLAARDEDRNLALLRLEGEAGGGGAGGSGRPSGYGWVLYDPDCGAAEPEERWTRLGSMGMGSEGRWRLGPPLPLSARGAPLVQPRGNGVGLVGIVTGEGQALALQVVETFVRSGLALGLTEPMDPFRH
jgi:hypothetical protein